MADTISEYFRRFDNSITESVYSAITMQDYYRNKAANQYLDYDKQSLFRKNKLYCGIRNIDNSCYLSVTLQILYNLQWLRQRIFRVPQNQTTQFLRELQRLFSLMYKGTLIYVDPTNLFAVLKKLHPNVFVTGNQNDFHQVFTIILDQLQKSLTNEDDKRFFKKMFYGRMKVQLTDQKGKISNNVANDMGNSFNLINLPSNKKNFQAALKDFKSEIIQGYVNDSGEKMKASKQINFLETPAILSFFINRVSFINNKLVKDSSQFEFEQKILFAKSNAANKLTNSKLKDTQIQKQIKILNQWITFIENKKITLISALSYLQQKQFTDINTPTIQNPLGQQLKQNTKKYIKIQIQQIDKKIQKTKKQIYELQNKRIKQAQQNYTQVYNLWGVMIHYGSTAESGHYKICLKVDTKTNKWIQFNDRRAQQITNDKILQYKKNGQICCIFYRRNTLQSEPQKGQITSSLKKYVKDQQQDIFKKIDNARILQALYQQFQSINIIWDYQNLAIRQQQKISTYFFKPLMHLIIKGIPSQVCKGFLLYQEIKQQKFILNIKSKFIDPTRNITIPNIDFGIPKQYWSISQGVKQFLSLQINSPLQAYQLISFYMDITITDKITRQIFIMLRQVILLKGLFYQSMFVEFNLMPTYQDYSKIIDRILCTLQTDDPYLLIMVPIRQDIRKKYLNKIINKDQQAWAVMKKQVSIAPVMMKQIGPALFAKRFGYWIQQRKRIGNLDQSILNQYKKYYDTYVTKLN